MIFTQSKKCDFMDFAITWTKWYFWGGVHDVDPPKHTILNIVYYLQELKTIILEKSVFPVIVFFILEDVSAKTQGLRFNIF